MEEIQNHLNEIEEMIKIYKIKIMKALKELPYSDKSRATLCDEVFNLRHQFNFQRKQNEYDKYFPDQTILIYRLLRRLTMLASLL